MRTLFVFHVPLDPPAAIVRWPDVDNIGRLVQPRGNMLEATKACLAESSRSVVHLLLMGDGVAGMVTECGLMARDRRAIAVEHFMD